MIYRPTHKPAATRTGTIRRWILHRVLCFDGESCDRCGRGYRVIGCWWCDDDEWFAAVHSVATGWPPRYAECVRGLLCPRCFDRASREIGVRVEWVPRDLMERVRAAKEAAS